MAEPRRFNKQTFEEWRNHRLTGAFLQFLRDQRHKMAEQWASGQEMDLRHQTKALLMGDLADLAWRDVADFYEIPADDDEQTESDPQ